MPEHTMPRREFLQGAVAAAALYRQSAPSQPSAKRPAWVLVGTGGNGIYRARWNENTGELGVPELAIATPTPSFLALHPYLPVVYACNEGAGEAAAVSAFSLGREGATLTAIGRVLTRGDSPCFVSVDPTGKLLFAANYGGGSLGAFPLDAVGKPGPAARVFACAGNPVCGPLGPVADRQDAPHFHCATLSPGNKFVLACDLGEDAIFAFAIQPGSRTLHDPIRIPARRGSGPRHLAFHPNGGWLYCIHELDCTVDMYTWHEGETPRAELLADSVVAVRPAAIPVDPSHPSTGAELAITRDGRFLYASTRGVDLLTVFRVDGRSGRLTTVQQVSSAGRTPRFFALDPSQHWLVCAHQDGNSVTVFGRDGKTGRLTPQGTQPVSNPQCLLWV